ncbi:hypothetical protein E3J62_02075 [candidate division TA06 bacterium]|uniref:Uncharacterized protein n=1 Tax=candidate division TA06 bacterium TaxID=2250710 RepID=A0A523UXL2_UNCT6|nr:MAG: hypothetical protein E3J62_02075 [candidate division TA06 bacterium]
MRLPKLVRDSRKGLEKEIQTLPSGFYDSFEYTRAGKNLTHPRTLGCIVKVLLGFDSVKAVDIDIRMNIGRVRFQPDIQVIGTDDTPILFIDYESPNSSDARIPRKDVLPYLKLGRPIPYIVITTLPDAPKAKWKTRVYPSSASRNRGRVRQKIRESPRRFWYNNYRHELKKLKNRLDSVYFFNIDGKKVMVAPLFKKT